MKQEYTLDFDTAAGDALEGLPSEITHRIFKKIQGTKQDPHHFWSRMEGRTDYRIRVGDYRAIADIHDDKRLIYVTKIGHRKTVYESI